MEATEKWGCNWASPHELEKSIGHSFTNRTLLRYALTHKSIDSVVHYDRFEFLGDAVLSMVVAGELYRRYPEADSGAMTQMRAYVVRRQTLALVAEDMGLQKYVMVGKSLRGAKGKSKQMKDRVLEDVFEALIAALYLDAGLETAAKFIVQHLGQIIDNLSGDMRHAKTRLQELTQPLGWRISYEIITRRGPSHAPEWAVWCVVNAEDRVIKAKGMGPTKQIAESSAAEKVLERINDNR